MGDGFPRRSLASSSRILFMASVAPLDFAFHSVGPRQLGKVGMRKAKGEA